MSALFLTIHSTYSTALRRRGHPPQEQAQDEHSMKLAEAPPIDCLRCLQHFPDDAVPVLRSHLDHDVS